jgi:DNA polymerase/3'-5' exonuclease PolX
VLTILSLHSAENVTTSQINNLDLTKHIKTKLIAYHKMQLPDRKKHMNSIKTNGKSTTKNAKLIYTLTTILGIGNKKAKELIVSGLTSASQLKLQKWRVKLSDATILLMDLNPERKIPKTVIDMLKPILIAPVKKAIIVGSYRRNAPFSKDIDVMVTSDNSTILQNYIDKLSKSEKIHVYNSGEKKISFVLEKFGKNYKVDVFKVAPLCCHFMLLYSTGSKNFNIKMRAQARRMGYTLNQYGLYKINKISNRNIKNVQDIFRALNMQYVPPHARI